MANPIYDVKVSGTVYSVTDSGAPRTNDVYTKNQANYRFISGGSLSTGSTYDTYYLKKGDGMTSLASMYFGKINGKSIEASSTAATNSFSLVETSAVTSSVTSASTDVVTSGGVYDQLGGMKIVKLSHNAYDALTTKDNSTMYLIVD